MGTQVTGVPVQTVQMAQGTARIVDLGFQGLKADIVASSRDLTDLIPLILWSNLERSPMPGPRSLKERLERSSTELLPWISPSGIKVFK